MNDYLSQVNSGSFYLIVALIMAYITIMCFVFLIKSYRAGIKIGMDKKLLKKTIMSSATFTLLPSVSILLGVVALSGTLGVPFSWLRLSVIGSLQYELNVAEIAAQSVGLSGLRVDEMNMGVFVTVALVMTVGILGSLIFTTLLLKKYLKRIQKAPKKAEAVVSEAAMEENEQNVKAVKVLENSPEDNSKSSANAAKKNSKGFGTYATTAMFIGLCGAFIGAYVGKAVPREGSDVMPLVVALIAAGVMAVFEFFIQKKGKAFLENFSLAVSMLAAMAGAVIIGLF